jgi:hypothetical protein
MRPAVLGFMALATVAYSQQPKPDDVPGWTKTTWGMTKAEVQAALGDDVKIPSEEVLAKYAQGKPGTMLWIPFYKLPGGSFRALLWFRDDRLSGVTLAAHATGDAGLDPKDAVVPAAAFEILYRELSSKYGPAPVQNGVETPDKDLDRAGGYKFVDRSARWVFLTTDITLSLIGAQGLRAEPALIFEYRPHKTNDRL